jgi:hypothetical protein
MPRVLLYGPSLVVLACRQRSTAQQHAATTVHWRHFQFSDPLSVIPGPYRKVVTSTTVAVAAIVAFSYLRQHLPTKLLVVVD